MDLSENPLSERQYNYLKSGSTLVAPGEIKNNLNKNKGKSQIRVEITTHLEKSLLYMHYILPYSSELSNERIYEILNAQTLMEILKNLLVDVRKRNHSLRSYSYDFRTVELARAMCEISTNYLKEIAPDNKTISEDIRRVSDHFKIIAKFQLKQESNKELSENEGLLRIREEKKLKDEFNRSNEQLKIIIDGEKYSNLRKEIIALRNRMIILDQTTRDGIASRSYYEKKKKTIENTISNKKEQMKSMIEPWILKARKITAQLFGKYDHLKKYYCPVNSLSEFKYDSQKFGFNIGMSFDESDPYPIYGDGVFSEYAFLNDEIKIEIQGDDVSLLY